MNTAIAHTPSSISMDYNYSSNVLEFRVNHAVSDVNTHYIELIEIFVNDVFNQSRPYTSQTTTSYHEDTFTVPADIGDVIKLVAYCNVAGSLTDEIVIEDPNGNGTGTEKTSAESVLIVSLALAIGFILMRRRKF